MWPWLLLGDGGERDRPWWPPTHTNLAGLGVDIAHAEEPPDHVHVILLLNGRQCCQHESCIAGFVLVVHVTDPCGDGQSQGGSGCCGAGGRHRLSHAPGSCPAQGAVSHPKAPWAQTY